MSRTLWAVVAMAGIGLAAGCGDSKDTAGALAVEGKSALQEVADMLKLVSDEGKKPPARMADLESVEGYLPTAGGKIRSGELVYLWGAGYVSGGTQVVAYEKKAPDEGGYVLLQDGTVKNMSATEFKSAAKAK
jgi:hypothetical protein